MARLVRDLGKKANKPVEFVMAGEDTELDKTVVDRIGDPLVHMIRNAVDHGLEADPEDRKRAGKPETGRVELRAYHKGGNIYIEVEDDGRGLDREAILAKARERGVVDDSDVLSDREIFNLIFEPGFSTAKKVTDVSGRGVGMDVVRRNIEALRGQVEIRSEPGKGSVFIIRLPLTLAIIDGMVIRVGLERYIIPTLSVVMSIRPDKKDLSTVLQRGEMLALQGSLIPLFRLGRLFSVDGAEQDPTKSLVIIVEDDGERTGLVTDELLGQQQIVIKTLGETMRGIPGVSGGAIMPDGQVGLILDVGGLVKLANAKSNGIL
jgi:two-component system chemotaxis sensor kinase CheA